MPESVRDRCTRAHEYIFLLSKHRQYYYDADAIRTPLRESSIKRGRYGWSAYHGEDEMTIGARAGSSFRKMAEGKMTMGDSYNPKGANKRSVWTVATRPYHGAHFATFPTALVEPMVLAGSRVGDVVLDPFAGTGTVGEVCIRHGRHFAGVEINMQYIRMARERMSGVQISLFGQQEVDDATTT